MTMKHIKIFIAVCDTGSMTAAAKKLFIAQPAVSFAIAEMEDHYGQKLFDRISNRLHITEAGKHFLQYAKQVSALFDEMENEIINWDSIGTLHIGSNTDIGTYLFPALVHEFKTSHPGVEIQAVIDRTEKLEELLLDNQLDIALIEGQPSNKFITFQKFFHNSLVFVCPPSHPWAGQIIPKEHLNHQDFLMREKNSSQRKLLEKFFQLENIHVNVVWESLSPESLLNGAARGLGVTALSREYCREALAKGTLADFQIENVLLEWEFHVIYHQNKFLTNRMQDFIELCIEWGKNHESH